MEKNFDFKSAEATIYKRHLDEGAFTAKVDKNKKPYCIVMPPPNVTSRLHAGHALCYTIQDIIIRFKRMQGFETLLLPGADHAAIATEVKIIEELKKQGIDKNTLTREQFLVHVEAWYKKYTAEIKSQIMRLGVSCDWSRFAFTMDPQSTKAVNETFDHLYNKGLIYKGKRMVNVCPGCKSAISDAEIEYKTVSRDIYHVSYGSITVATVRPETIPGDVAIAVHPKDKRYAKLVGQFVFNPITGAQMPIIADEYVDMKFGTGALKITPAHDPADFEIGQRHNLEPIFVSDLSDTARKTAIEKLEQSGALVATKKYTGNISVCYRCRKPIEPTISDQWFLKMTDLAKPAIAALNNGLVILPKKFEKTYLHWLNNIKDWCISRQLLSGHRIPIKGETDVLDTWFSAALWPFSTLNGKDRDYFYPTQTMVTGYDIIFFWVIRMVFMGKEITGKLPFQNVLLHGLVRDAQGRKMSKSLGNGIDPIDIIDEFGADVLRFSLIAGTKLDRDPRYSVEKATLARNFCNKIWNAVKFFKLIENEPQPEKESLADKWILTKLNTLVKSIIKKYEKFDFGVAANELQQFFWSDFCDWYIEESKSCKNPRVFGYVLKVFLKLLNPIMPFITEHIWTVVLGYKIGLINEPFPCTDKTHNFPKAKKEFDLYIEEIKQQRNAKDELENRAKQIESLKKEIARGENMLSNKNFVDRAPKDLVKKEQEKLAENKATLSALTGGGK
ncbi:MAG: valine--tRNA ligase [Firmicutes bacterium]|nr:valine--tRNA ligase [Bacillota bacterium]